MKLLWEDRAWDDYLYWQAQDKKNAQTYQQPYQRYPEKYV